MLEQERTATELRAQIGQAHEAVPAAHVFSAADERRLRAQDEELRVLRSTQVNNALLQEQIYSLQQQVAAATEQQAVAAKVEAENDELRKAFNSHQHFSDAVTAMGCA